MLTDEQRRARSAATRRRMRIWSASQKVLVAALRRAANSARRWKQYQDALPANAGYSSPPPEMVESIEHLRRKLDQVRRIHRRARQKTISFHPYRAIRGIADHLGGEDNVFASTFDWGATLDFFADVVAEPPYG